MKIAVKRNTHTLTHMHVGMWPQPIPFNTHTLILERQSATSERPGTSAPHSTVISFPDNALITVSRRVHAFKPPTGGASRRVG